MGFCRIHTDADRREKWCRTSYKVTVVDGGEEFDCDSGQFAHMGLLSSHVLKVITPANSCRINYVDERLLCDSNHLMCSVAGPRFYTRYRNP